MFFSSNKPARTLTWNPCFSSLQAGASRADLVGAPLAQRPHGELEGAAGHVLAAVLDADCVNAHLLGHKADTVRVLPHGHDLCLSDAARGAGDVG